MSLFNVEEESSLGFVNDGKSGVDGLYRPSYKKATDPKKGYTAVIRFLPWVLNEDDENGSPKTGPNGLHRIMNYVKIEGQQELNGLYDSPANFKEKCALSKLYFDLDKSTNPVLKDRAICLNKVNKYYSLVLIVEDSQNPDAVGKIMVYSYGWKILQKMQAEENGENVEGRKCNIYDVAEGKDFKLVVKNVGDFENYDSSLFLERSSIKINGKSLPIQEKVFTNKAGKEITKKIIREDLMPKLTTFLRTREEGVDLEKYMPTRLTDEQLEKIDKIVKILTNTSTEGSNALFNSTDPMSAEDLFGSSSNETAKTAATPAPVKETKPAAQAATAAPKAPVQQKVVATEEDPFADLGDKTPVDPNEDPFADLD